MQKYNVLAEVKELVDSDVVLEAEEVIEAYMPDDVFITLYTWQQATHETRQLLAQAVALDDRILPAFRHCVSMEHWQMALYLYMAHANAPDHICLSPVLNTAEEIITKEVEFVANARKWIEETNELLGGI